MIRIVIFGNSGSGKSTLAQHIKESRNLAHLDLDTIAWKEPGVREELAVSAKKLNTFMATNEQWVIEGCYSSLIELAAPQSGHLIFVNPGTEACQENCRSRPWEPHKYASKAEQDKNLEMLIEWVAQYDTRDDEFSYSAHRKLFNAFMGNKTELKSNAESQALSIGQTD